jgi:hypothetical protein
MNDVRLNTVLLSHLHDIPYDLYGNEPRAEVRARFIRSLIFHNEDTSIWISQGYLDFMWDQAEERKGNDCSYAEYEAVINDHK